MDLNIYQCNTRELSAKANSLPLAVSFSGVDTLPGTVRARATADNVDFTIIQAMVKSVSNVTGKLSGDFTLDGTWGEPNLSAKALLSDATMRIDTLGITLTKLAGGIVYARDTLRVDS